MSDPMRWPGGHILCSSSAVLALWVAHGALHSLLAMTGSAQRSLIYTFHMGMMSLLVV